MKKKNTSLFFLSIFKPSFNVEFSKANFNPLASSGSYSDVTLNLTSPLCAVLMMNSFFLSTVFALLEPLLCAL